MTEKPRVISWFSCGAASAIATVLAAIRYGSDLDIVYCRVREEHEDNLRFLSDFEKAFGLKVKIIENTEYEGSIYNVFARRKYIKDRYGAPCTMLLKREMRKQYQRPTDIQVFGYTSEEQDRADRFIDANNEVNEWFPLIENSIGKKECLSLIKDAAGIELPIMYRLGYQNNNCIGCVKGGMGYWNKIRKDFPLQFKRMSEVERTVGHAICKDKNGPVYLDQLDPSRGRFIEDSPADCGFTCESKNEK